MVMVTTLGAEVGAIRCPTGVFLGVNGDVKYEDYCVGVTMVVGSSGVCCGGSGELSTLVELFGADGGYDIGSTIGISYGNIYGNLEVYPLGEWIFGSEARSEISSYIGISYGSI